MSVRQLRYLAQGEVVVPSVRPSAGPGAEALYSPENLFALVVIEKVRAICGQEFRTERLRILVAELHRAQSGSENQLVIDDSGVWVHQGPVNSALRLSSAALLIDLDGVRAETQRRLRVANITTSAALAA
jgi:hypothetical protein